MFQKAVKYEAKLRLAIAGPSGAGKTYTALAVATSLGSRVALVDTEHGSASKYADLFDFDVMELAPPFHPDRFGDAISMAADEGYDVVVLDSVSHAWNGTGGALELVDEIAIKYKGNTYAAWSEVTPIHNRLIEAIVGAPLHVIVTMRSKSNYILVEKRGKQMPEKVGMAPIQREGFEYEFDVFLVMDVENNAIVDKTRCKPLTGKVFAKPGGDLADILKDWLVGVDPGQMALDATDLDDFANAAWRIDGVRLGFDSPLRLSDWVQYVSTGDGYDAGHNADYLTVLSTYCSQIADGILPSQAAPKALETMADLWSSASVTIGTVAPEEEPGGNDGTG